MDRASPLRFVASNEESMNLHRHRVSCLLLTLESPTVLFTSVLKAIILIHESAA